MLNNNLKSVKKSLIAHLIDSSLKLLLYLNLGSFQAIRKNILTEFVSIYSLIQLLFIIIQRQNTTIC